MGVMLMSQEEEFTALIRIAPFSQETVKKFCGTLEQALRDHPEWASHLLTPKSIWKQKWTQRVRRYRFHFFRVK